MVAIVGFVLLVSIGAYAYWSVNQTVAGNKIASGSMTLKVVDFGEIDVSPINVAGIMPGDAGLAATWEMQIGSAPAQGDDLAFAVSGVTDDISLADNVQIAFCLCTGGVYNWWLTPTGPVALGASNPDDPAVYKANSFKMSDYEGISWANMQGYTGLMPSDDPRHLKIYYYLPEDCASDCHDDSATFNVMVEALQHH